jgi:uncharacterized protein (TIGR02246 family)
MRISLRVVPWLLAALAISLGWIGLGRHGAIIAADEPGSTSTASGKAAKATKSETMKVPDDEQSVRAGAIAYTKAFNAHDAKSLAALFALKAEFVDEDGNTIKGREAIEKEFTELFRQKPKTMIEIQVSSVRMLTPNIAVEEGTVRTTPAPDEPVSVSSYLAVNLKIDGKWLVGSVKDFDSSNSELTAHDHLMELAWLVGDWVDESPDATVKSSCKWADSGNFLLQQFEVQVSGSISIKGTMRIGWDPVAKQFHSWVFDSEGGFSEGLWVRDGNDYVVKSHGVTSAGAIASATGIYRNIDKDTITWQQHDRVLAGQRAEDIDEVIIKRRPPAPAK